MPGLFITPHWLWAGIPLAWYLWHQHQPSMSMPGDRRRRIRTLFRALTLGALLLILSGLQWPGPGRPIQLIAAVDLSESIHNRAEEQERALRELSAALPREAELGVVVFGKNPALERGLGRLPEISADSGGSNINAAASSAQAGPNQPPPLPHLRTVQVAVNAQASDLGAALDFARGRFPAQADDSIPASRAIVFLSDGLDTEGRAALAAAALNGSGIDLLALPAALEAHADVLVESIRVPETGKVGLGLPVEVTVSGMRAVDVKVRLGRRVGHETVPVGDKVVTLAAGAELGAGKHLYRSTVRLVFHPKSPGAAVFVATLSDPDDRALLGDDTRNNTLHAAVRVEGPSRWAVLARPDSTMAALAAEIAENGRRPLGAELRLFTPKNFPNSEKAYAGFSGVIADDLSTEDLPPESKALHALAGAVRNGLSLLATGGEHAFGAGRHPEGGDWERLLPATFRPEDDRTRSILFLVDISNSMDGTTREGPRKLDIARAKLGELAQADPPVLRPTDRLGLMAFSSAPRLMAPVSPDPTRTAFVEALAKLNKTETKTDILSALEKAREILAGEKTEELLVVLLSDGVDTAGATPEVLEEAVRKLCPVPEGKSSRRRTTLHAFGIGSDPQDSSPVGDAALKRMAKAGGGNFYPEFMELARRLKEVVEDRDPLDLHVRFSPFGVQPRAVHPVLSAAGAPWPALTFRNRVQARTAAEVLLTSIPQEGPDSAAARGSRKPDPLLVLGHLGTARTALLSLTLQGSAGSAFLGEAGTWKGGQTLLAALLSWLEGRNEGDGDGWRVETRPGPGETLEVLLYAEESTSRNPRNGLEVQATLKGLEGGTEQPPSGAGSRAPLESPFPLLPEAPGRYRALLPAPPAGVYRLEIRGSGLPPLERFVTVSYPPEYRRFGTDRDALRELTALAGGHSRMLNLTQHDLKAWLTEQGEGRAYYPARPVLLVLAMLFLLAEIGARGMRSRR